MSPSGAVDRASTEAEAGSSQGYGGWTVGSHTNFRRPAGSGRGGPPVEVRDLSLPLIGEEQTPGDGGRVVGGLE